MRLKIRIPDMLAYKLQHKDHLPFGFRLQLVLDPAQRSHKLYYRLMR